MVKRKRLRTRCAAPRRTLTEQEVEDGLVSDIADAKESGMRAYRHWIDRHEPPSKMPSIAMREACPYPRGSDLADSFFYGWQETAGTLWDHVWCGAKYPERKGSECRVLSRFGRTVEVQFRRDGEKVRTVCIWVRRKTA